MEDFVYCGRCNTDVKVTEVKYHGDYEEQILGCGHTLSKHISNKPPTSISDKITATVSRLEQSQGIRVEEKIVNGKLSIQFSADTIEIIINDSIVNVNAQDEYTFTRSLSQKDELATRITTLRHDVERSSFENESKQKTLLLLERIDYIISPKEDFDSMVNKLRTWIIRNKWFFTSSSPFIMKIIDLIHDMIKSG
jgi:hypothetical protein